jgi:hypothetical protein
MRMSCIIPLDGIAGLQCLVAPVDAGAALSVALEQLGQRLDCAGCGVGALQPEAHQVHPQQAGRLATWVERCEDGLVSDGDGRVVHAVLDAPQPRKGSIRARSPAPTRTSSRT